MFHRFFCFLKRSLLTVLLVLLLLLLAAGGWFVYQGRQLYQSAASVTPIATLYDTISSRTHYAAYDQLPQTFVQAVICTEDEHFMTHKGIDPGAIFRALLYDLRTRSLAEGGSTLTQQLAKNALFTQEKRLTRKAAEAFAAIDMEKAYSKQQIFEMYDLFRQRLLWHRGSRRGLLRQDGCRAHRRRSGLSGRSAQRPLCLRQQPGTGPQAGAGGAEADGQVPGVHPAAG